MTDNWQIDAVLLDMDGTLLDTEPSYVSALTAALDAFGYPDATATCHALIGIPGAECEALLRLLRLFPTGDRDSSGSADAGAET